MIHLQAIGTGRTRCGLSWRADKFLWLDINPHRVTCQKCRHQELPGQLDLFKDGAA